MLLFLGKPTHNNFTRFASSKLERVKTKVQHKPYVDRYIDDDDFSK